MSNTSQESTHPRVRNRRVHLANERTFLAWVRTSIGVMAFGFVVEKFALFLRQISYFMEKSGLREPMPASPALPSSSSGFSSVVGIALVGLGALMTVLAFVRYKKVERQIDEDTYRPSAILDTLLALTVVALGLFLFVYLIRGI